MGTQAKHDVVSYASHTYTTPHTVFTLLVPKGKGTIIMTTVMRSNRPMGKGRRGIRRVACRAQVSSSSSSSSSSVSSPLLSRRSSLTTPSLLFSSSLLFLSSPPPSLALLDSDDDSALLEAIKQKKAARLSIEKSQITLQTSLNTLRKVGQLLAEKDTSSLSTLLPSSSSSSSSGTWIGNLKSATTQMSLSSGAQASATSFFRSYDKLVEAVEGGEVDEMKRRYVDTAKDFEEFCKGANIKNELEGF